MRAENENLKQQVSLLSDSQHKDTSKEIVTEDSAKTKTFLDMQNSFEVLLTQKDDVISSLHKRIGDLREDLLGKTCQLSELQQQPKVQPKVHSGELVQEELVVKSVEPECTSSKDVDDLVGSIEVDELKDELEKSNDRLRNATLQLKRTDESLNTTREELTAQRKEVEDLTKSLDATKQDLATKKKELEDLSKSISEMEEQLNKKTNEINSLTESQQVTKGELESKIGECKTVSESLRAVKEELKEKVSECADLSEENGDLKEEIVDLRECLQETEKGGSEFYRSHLEKEMETLKKMKDGYERELKNALETHGIEKVGVVPV